MGAVLRRGILTFFRRRQHHLTQRIETLADKAADRVVATTESLILRTWTRMTGAHTAELRNRGATPRTQQAGQ